jgi:hypothetical protein
LGISRAEVVAGAQTSAAANGRVRDVAVVVALRGGG